MLAFRKFITRGFARQNSDSWFVFGDNVARIGYGGQAAALRGEPNSIGVATKWAPSNGEKDFFSDETPGFDLARDVILRDVMKIEQRLAAGDVVYLPSEGIGTGLSDMPTRCPKLFETLVEAFAELYSRYNTEAAREPFPWNDFLRKE